MLINLHKVRIFYLCKSTAAGFFFWNLAEKLYPVKNLWAIIVNFCTCRTLQGDRIWTTAFSGNGQSSWEGTNQRGFTVWDQEDCNSWGGSGRLWHLGELLGRELFTEKDESYGSWNWAGVETYDQEELGTV